MNPGFNQAHMMDWLLESLPEWNGQKKWLNVLSTTKMVDTPTSETKVREPELWE